MKTLSGTYKNRILSLLSQRGPGKSICPSEVLPTHLKQSKAKMLKVRDAAEELRQEGRIEILRGGKPVKVESRGPIRLTLKSSPSAFDYSLNFKKINFRKHPELYRVGKGEQGVLLVEPYKSEILPFWKFKTPSIALESAKTIFSAFLSYGEESDFIGMDMARKFLQMGVTRSRRYANHKSGKKYLGPVPRNKRGQSGAHGRKIQALDPDPMKARCAQIFAKYLAEANANGRYVAWRKSQS